MPGGQAMTSSKRYVLSLLPSPLRTCAECTLQHGELHRVMLLFRTGVCFERLPLCTRQLHHAKAVCPTCCIPAAKAATESSMPCRARKPPELRQLRREGLAGQQASQNLFLNPMPRQSAARAPPAAPRMPRRSAARWRRTPRTWAAPPAPPRWLRIPAPGSCRRRS
jgi:hypothetical protein